MTVKISNRIEEVTWLDIRKDVASVNPEFCLAVDELDPPEEFSIFKVKYRYGEQLLQDGIFHLPLDEGGTAPLMSEEFSDDLKKKLGYAPSVPMGLALDRSLELFVNISNRIIPYVVMGKGAIFALTAVLEPEYSYDKGTYWNMSAGVRSTFLLPKISNLGSHKRLVRELGVKSRPPKTLMEQWQVFKQIANSSEVKRPWEVNVLFFSGKWFEQDKDPKWIKFRYFLLRWVWRRSTYFRNLFMHEMTLSNIQSHCNLMINPNLADTANHLFSVGSSSIPGFCVAADENLLPKKLIQSVYSDVYQLKNYAPTIIAANYFSYRMPRRVVYYSLPQPTLIDFSPNPRKLGSKIEDLRDLQYIMKSMLRQINKIELKVDSEIFSVSRAVDLADYHYLHHEADVSSEIGGPMDLLAIDKDLVKDLQRFPGRELCQTSKFFSGLVCVAPRVKA